MEETYNTNTALVIITAITLFICNSYMLAWHCFSFIIFCDSYPLQFSDPYRLIQGHRFRFLLTTLVPLFYTHLWYVCFYHSTSGYSFHHSMYMLMSVDSFNLSNPSITSLRLYCYRCVWLSWLPSLCLWLLFHSSIVIYYH